MTITRVYHVVDKKGGAREVDLVGFRRLISLLLELGEFLLLGLNLFPQLLELLTFVPTRVLVLMGLFLLIEALRSGDGALIGEAATEDWSDSSRDTTSDGISDSDGEHWWQ